MSSLAAYKIRTDFIVVIGMVLAFIPTILFFQLRFLPATLLLLGVPTLFLLVRKPKQVKRLVVSILAGMIVSFILEFLATINGAWVNAPGNQLIFTNKLFNLISIDALIWYLLWISITVVFYEHFFEHERTEKIPRSYITALAFLVVISIIIISCFYINPAILRIRYAYLVLGFSATIPFFYLIIKKSHLIGKLLKATIFSMFLMLSFELTALTLGQWNFPGEYVGYVQLLGLQFPFEEFIFWIIFGSPVILSYYELFVDDGK